MKKVLMYLSVLTILACIAELPSIKAIASSSESTVTLHVIDEESKNEIGEPSSTIKNNGRGLPTTGSSNRFRTVLLGWLCIIIASIIYVRRKQIKRELGENIK